LKFGERAIRRAVGRKLGQDSIRFVECNKHRDIYRKVRNIGNRRKRAATR
jgi:hypothetical protein